MKDLGIEAIKWIAIIGLVIYLVNIFGPKHPTGMEYWENPNFKTDTIIVNNYYTAPADSFVNYVPPKTVVSYQAPDINVTLALDSLIRLLNGRDTIGSINPNFVSQHPEAPKLIHGYFRKNQLNLTLLSTDGKTNDREYEVNFDRYEYEFRNGRLLADPIKPRFSATLKRTVGIEAFVWADYDVFQKQSTIGPDLQVRLGKIYTSVNPQLSIPDPANSGLKIRLGYKLK